MRITCCQALLLLLPLLLFFPSTADPDLLLDFCVADTSATAQSNVHLNGHPCIDPASATSAHFATSALSKPPPSASASLFGFAVTTTNATTLPGGNAQGLAMSRADIAAGGLVPPHAHPRASESALLLQGELLVGFVDTSYRLYTQQLRPGDAFVFPRGLVHFLYNIDVATPAVVLSGFNSQNPGVQLAPIALFRTEPRFPDEVLKKAFKISGQDVQRIHKNLGG
ncbi:germin-like protein 3-1 [Canna indica]|uniref:Germin-like protein n=1 Tax=Canna indica TaxID=4628 RepID=A0AAQ3JQ25_9LILI|nr:germin-like protein 3-1 [Canna indica]